MNECNHDFLLCPTIQWIVSLQFDWEYFDRFSILLRIVQRQMLDLDYELNHLRQRISIDWSSSSSSFTCDNSDRWFDQFSNNFNTKFFELFHSISMTKMCHMNIGDLENRWTFQIIESNRIETYVKKIK